MYKYNAIFLKKHQFSIRRKRNIDFYSKEITYFPQSYFFG